MEQGEGSGSSDDRLDAAVRRLMDSMDVIRARSKTFKDERDIHEEEALRNLDELADAIAELKRELRGGGQ